VASALINFLEDFLYQRVGLFGMREFVELRQKGARLACISLINNKLVYHLDLDGKYKIIELEPKDAESIVAVFPNADFFERELHEKDGIKIKGASRKRLFTE
jgi:NADH:ubiquinone oxidoreductase subunit C